MKDQITETYVCKITAQVHLRIGSLLSDEDKPLAYAELYVFDTENEVRPVRLAYQSPASSTFISEQTSSSTFLSEQISTSQTNTLVEFYRMISVASREKKRPPPDIIGNTV
jgi:hypothetical protein